MTYGGESDAGGRAAASSHVERGGKRELSSQSYSVSFRSVLIVVALMVALIVGATLILT